MRLRASLFALFFCACARSPAPGTAEVDFRPRGGGAPVATFNGGTIGLDEVQDRLRAVPPDEAARLSSEKGKHDYVESMARFELLAQEGVRRGLANDPEVLAAAKRVIVHKLLAGVQAPAPTDAQVTAYFQAHQAQFTKPAMYRLSELVVPTAAEASALTAELAKIYPEDDTLLAKVAKAKNAKLDVDLRYQTLAELVGRIGPLGVDAVRPLDRLGEVSKPVTETDGVHLYWLRGKVKGLALSLDEVRPSIQAQLQLEARTQAVEALEKKLADDANLSIDDAALTHLKVNAEATR